MRKSSSISVLLIDQNRSRVGEHFAPPAAGQKRSWWSKVLFLKLPLVHPEKFLDRLYPKVRWCLTPGFVALMIGTVAAAVGVAFTNRESLVFSLETIFSVESLLLNPKPLEVLSQDRGDDDVLLIPKILAQGFGVDSGDLDGSDRAAHLWL